MPFEFIAALTEFEVVFSGKLDKTYSQNLRLLISLANGHPRTLEIIYTEIKYFHHVGDLNLLFSKVTTAISSRITIDNGFNFPAEFLYHFVVHAFFVPKKKYHRKYGYTFFISGNFSSKSNNC